MRRVFSFNPQHPPRVAKAVLLLELLLLLSRCLGGGKLPLAVNEGQGGVVHHHLLEVAPLLLLLEETKKQNRFVKLGTLLMQSCFPIEVRCNLLDQSSRFVALVSGVGVCRL